jgi:MSHA biogenesis protein MshI
MWFKKKTSIVSSGVVGLEITPEGIAMVYVKPRPQGGWEVPFCSFIEEHGSENQRRALFQLVEQHGLKGVNCHYVLHPSEYELLLTDAPEVEEDELANAIKWRAKDLLSMPMDEAVIDAFSLPKEAYRGRMKMIYVVSTRRSGIVRLVEVLQHSGLNLAVIDVTELALRNLIKLCSVEQGKSVALLRLRSTGGIINLIQDGQLCFTRSIETPLQEFEIEATPKNIEINRNKVDRLVLEIQRSLDYYEAQIGMGAVNQIWLIPLKTNIPALVDTLRERLPLTLNVLDLNKVSLLKLEADIPLIAQAFCFGALGAALRGEH